MSAAKTLANKMGFDTVVLFNILKYKTTVMSCSQRLCSSDFSQYGDRRAVSK